MKTFNLKIERDEHQESPRGSYNLGTMYCKHSRYNLGDVYADKPEKKCISLPLYLYDHSGITMNTTGFSCNWDSGQVGVIYVDIEKVKSDYKWKRLTKNRTQQIKDSLKIEVETYDAFLTGDIYGFIITDNEDEEVDSCWGFYGYEYCQAEGERMRDYFITEEEKNNLAVPVH